MKNIQKSAEGGSKKQYISLTVRLPEAMYFALQRLAKEHSISFAHTVRLAVERKLADYLVSVRYRDRTQAAEIMAAASELTEVCSDIVNNARRIGFNFSQEVRLRYVEKKFDLDNDNSKGTLKEIHKKECENEQEKIKKIYPDMNEVKSIIDRFEAAADKMEQLAWKVRE